jgi:hypothetical protein
MKPFTTNIDAETGLIEATLFGFWDISMCKEFIAHITQVQAMLEASGRQPLLLVNTTEQGVQLNEVAEALREFARHVSNLRRRTAVITKGALHRLQAKRIKASEAHRLFEDADAARAWLLRPGVNS